MLFSNQTAKTHDASYRKRVERLITLWQQNTFHWRKISIPSWYLTKTLLNRLEIIFETHVWQLGQSCQIHDLINNQDTQTWPNSWMLKSFWISAEIGAWKSPSACLIDWKTSHWYSFYPFHLSASSTLWYTCQGRFLLESVFCETCLGFVTMPHWSAQTLTPLPLLPHICICIIESRQHCFK